jgi:xanthine/uracil permease
VVQWAAGLMVLQGVVGKLGAVFIIIPQPIVGGLFCVMFGMISAFGERCTLPNFINYFTNFKNFIGWVTKIIISSCSVLLNAR